MPVTKVIPEFMQQRRRWQFVDFTNKQVTQKISYSDDIDLW